MSFGQSTSENQLSKLGLKGNVRLINEKVKKTIINEDGTLKKTIDSETITEFDFKGNFVQLSAFRNGKLISYINYDYNENDCPIRATDYNADGSIYLVINYIYGDDGFIKEQIYDRSAQKTYDSNRESIDIEYFTYYQGLFTKVVFENDFMGRVQVKSFYTDKGDFSYKYTYEYDYLGNCTVLKYYNSAGSVSWQSKYQYDRNGRVKVKKLFKNNYLAQTTKYIYEIDDSENWINRTETSKVVKNIFGQLLNDEIIETTRIISYF